MFCSQCGVENQLEARFCQKCGNALSGEISHSKATAQPQVIYSAIWNPNAAANWSLIFTPAFGAYLQMLNWRTLGEAEKSASSRNWFYVSVGMLVIYALLGLFMRDANAAEGASRGLGFLFLLIWYFSVGRAQGKYVKAKFGASYSRKPWGKVLLIGVAAFIGLFFAAVIVVSPSQPAQQTYQQQKPSAPTPQRQNPPPQAALQAAPMTMSDIICQTHEMIMLNQTLPFRQQGIEGVGAAQDSFNSEGDVGTRVFLKQYVRQLYADPVWGEETLRSGQFVKACAKVHRGY